MAQNAAAACSRVAQRVARGTRRLSRIARGGAEILRSSLLASVLLCALLALPGTLTAQAVAQGDDPNLARLAAEIDRIAAELNGVLGVGALHLETGRAVYLNGSDRFPMASSFKVPIAVQLLTMVDRGQMRLDSMIALRPGDLHPGSGVLTELFDDPGVALSVRNLLELMLLISDNSATDILLREVGGADAVNARMRALGVEGVRVDRPTLGLIADWAGVCCVPADYDLSIEQYRELARSTPRERRDSAAAAFDNDPRDTSTPAGMVALLARIADGTALRPESSELLLDIMTRSTTGGARIKGHLPGHVSVAHKTGTIGGTTNDVGIITLPGDAGRIAIAMFVKGSPVPVERREHTIAEVSRAIYDYFLFQPQSAAHTLQTRQGS
ncbi:MAG: class A beta-lactamase [Candidatus Cloacimonetes bacterium]|jgi:beta-lactamase class A|nr:class A beta-lactamase [Candidatus Cloacimonadota bacterium]